MRCVALATLLAAAAVSAADIAVTVGSGGGLTFSPTSVSASAGDVITFTFESGQHTVTQSTFNSPCVEASSAIDSGFIAVGSTFQVTVNSTDPIWLYCRTSSHCQDGMVFAVNPTADKTFAQFLSNAKNGGSSSGSSNSGSSNSATGTSTSAGSSASSSKTNAGVIVNYNVAGLLALVGLVAGSVC